MLERQHRLKNDKGTVGWLVKGKNVSKVEDVVDDRKFITVRITISRTPGSPCASNIGYHSIIHWTRKKALSTPLIFECCPLYTANLDLVTHGYHPTLFWPCLVGITQGTNSLITCVLTQDNTFSWRAPLCCVALYFSRPLTYFYIERSFSCIIVPLATT